jgi:ATP-dependent exoDNAse (exonuclease V) beta subunit
LIPQLLEPGTDPEVLADGEQTLRTLPDFLIDVALLTDADNNDPNDQDRVSLMTVHSSKGLEFPYVYMVGLEENLFPNMMAVQSRADLEEERRLFYVAITRAEKRATLSYATAATNGARCKAQSRAVSCRRSIRNTWNSQPGTKCRALAVGLHSPSGTDFRNVLHELHLHSGHPYKSAPGQQPPALHHRQPSAI